MPLMLPAMHSRHPIPLGTVLLLSLALRTTAGTVTNEAPRLTLVPPMPFYLYEDGAKPGLEITWTNPPAAHGAVTVRATDAWGQEVFHSAVTLTGAVTRVGLPRKAAEHRYLKLAVTGQGRAQFAPAALSFVVLPPPVPQDRRFGFNAQPARAPVVKRLGGLWVRNHIPWEQDAADKPFRTNGIEHVIRTTVDGGCEVFGISSYSLAWASVVATNDDRPMRNYFSVPRPEPWEAYILHAAQQIRGRVPAFEVWNEWNFDMFWRSVPDTPEQRLDDYAALLKRSYAILKQAAPELRVTTGSMVTTRDSDSQAQLRGLLARGCARSFDIVNVHYYRGAGGPEGRTWQPAEQGSLDQFLDGFTNILASAHLSTPLWMTEMGWSSTDPGWGYVSEFEQACCLVRSHVLCFSRGVEVVLWFKLDEEPFGIMAAQAGSKPAVAAYAQLVRALQGRSFARPLATDTARAYGFTGGNGALVIAWASRPTAWSLPADLSLTRAENMLGEPVRLSPAKPLPLDRAPLYLWCAGGL